MSAFEKAFPTFAKLLNRGGGGGAPAKAPKEAKPGKGPKNRRPGKRPEDPQNGKAPKGVKPAVGRKPRRPRSAGATVVGLDIDPGQVVAAQVKVTDAIRVEKAAGRPLPLEVYRDGEVVDTAALTEVLRDLFKGSGLSTRVRLGLANQRVIVRTVELPVIPDRKELAAAVRFSAQDHIPMPIDSVVLDFQALDVIETPEGPRQRVLLVAARRDIVERLLEAVEAAGLKPEGVDLAAFALIRALRAPGSPPDETVLYISLGGLSNLALAEGARCAFTRVLSVGLESLIEQIAERCAVPYGEARSLMREVGMRAEATAHETLVPYAGTSVPQPQIEPDEPATPSEPAYDAEHYTEPPADDENAPEPAYDGAPELPEPAYDEAPEIPEPTYDPYADVLGAAEPGEPAPTIPEAVGGEAAGETGAAGEFSDAEKREIVRTVIADGVRQIAAESLNSLEFHGSGERATLDRIVVSGPGTEVPGLVEGLEAELRQPVTAELVKGVNPGSGGDVPLSRLAVAAGLAVAEASA